jgi:hypothetical protein
MIQLQTIPNIPIDSVSALLASLLGISFLAIRFLYVSKDKASNEHKEDLKYFNDERAKTVNEITQALHKISLSIEEDKTNKTEIKNNLNRLITLMEVLKIKTNENH